MSERALQLLERIAVALEKLARPEPMAKSQRPDRSMRPPRQEVVQWLQREYDRLLSIPALAKMCGLSPETTRAALDAYSVRCATYEALEAAFARETGGKGDRQAGEDAGSQTASEGNFGRSGIDAEAPTPRSPGHRDSPAGQRRRPSP